MSIISDLATLVNAGIKPSEILELVKADKDTPEAMPVKVTPIAEVNPAEAKADDKPDENEPDYKALYEKAKKDLDEIQNENSSKKVELVEPTMDEIIKNIKAEICR